MALSRTGWTTLSAHGRPSEAEAGRRPCETAHPVPALGRVARGGVGTTSPPACEQAGGDGGCQPSLTRETASDHLRILVTRPEPTVRPPSRMAKPRPSSMAMGWMSSTVISVVSPGMTISVPSGSVMTPVTSVVRK